MWFSGGCIFSMVTAISISLSCTIFIVTVMLLCTFTWSSQCILYFFLFHKFVSVLSFPEVGEKDQPWTTHLPFMSIFKIFWKKKGKIYGFTLLQTHLPTNTPSVPLLPNRCFSSLAHVSVTCQESTFPRWYLLGLCEHVSLPEPSHKTTDLPSFLWIHSENLHQGKTVVSPPQLQWLTHFPIVLLCPLALTHSASRRRSSITIRNVVPCRERVSSQGRVTRENWSVGRYGNVNWINVNYFPKCKRG